ncbi:MAG: hypothetical protein ACRDIV_17910 [Ktedonobacteraceae bacterium]
MSNESRITLGGLFLTFTVNGLGIDSQALELMRLPHLDGTTDMSEARDQLAGRLFREVVPAIILLRIAEQHHHSGATLVTGGNVCDHLILLRERLLFVSCKQLHQGSQNMGGAEEIRTI